MNVAIAANPGTALDAALHAAGGLRTITLLDAEQQAAILDRLPVTLNRLPAKLAPLPIEVLDIDTETLELLRSWGVRDCKSLANLNELPLIERLGERGFHLQRLARGEIKRELGATAPLECFQANTELEQTLDLLEPLAFILNRLLTQLMEHLRMRSLGTDHVQVELTLAPASDRKLSTESLIGAPSIYRRTLKLALPTQDEKILLKLLQLDLAAHPPAAPIAKIAIEVFPAEMRVEYGNLFRREGCDPAKIDLTMAKLRALMNQKDGQDGKQTGSAFLSDSHKPDRCEMLPFLQDLHRGATRGYQFKQANRLRRFRPPIPASVEVAHEVPSVVHFQRVRRQVSSISGPWCLGTEWWNQPAEWNRNEWNVELTSPYGTGVYRIFQNHLSARWFVEGIYD